MTLHRTDSGSVEFLCRWGNGQGTRPNPNRPATLITDDGDGNFQQWKYRGRLEDALVTLAHLERGIGENNIAVRNGAGYTVMQAPRDFWIERDGEYVPNLAAYPDVIAY